MIFFIIISLAYALGGHHHGHSHDEEHDHSHVENETGETLPHKVKTPSDIIQLLKRFFFFFIIRRLISTSEPQLSMFLAIS